MNKEVVDALVCRTLNGRYEVTKVSLGEMREEQVLVRMVATGVCHTDFSVANVMSRQRGTLDTDMANLTI